jgi:hypothetical protein
MDFTSYLLRWLLMRLPLHLLVVAGVLLAVMRWKRHPKVSLLTLAGLCLWELESFAHLLVRFCLPDWAKEYGWANDRLNIAFIVLNLTQDFFFSAVLILLVAAAFSQRRNNLTTYS